MPHPCACISINVRYFYCSSGQPGIFLSSDPPWKVFNARLWTEAKQEYMHAEAVMNEPERANEHPGALLVNQHLAEVVETVAYLVIYCSPMPVS